MSDTNESGEPDESPFLERDFIPTARALQLLRGGDIDVKGRMPYSSNMTFLVDIEHRELKAQAIYKPHRGERPLWDFPDGLYKREVAAFELSDHLGWDVVPPTVLRDGPMGIGSMQLFMPSDFTQHYLTLVEENDDHDDVFKLICAFDILANNTDRKSGHCLIGNDGRIWAIDNGLAFHEEFKLRTVIWEFAGQDLPTNIVVDLEEFLDNDLPDSLMKLLDENERAAMLGRGRHLLIDGEFPIDHTGHRYPWPIV